jgi:hypothetical protein
MISRLTLLYQTNTDTNKFNVNKTLVFMKKYESVTIMIMQ